MMFTVKDLKDWLSHFDDDEQINLASDMDGESGDVIIYRKDPWGLFSFEDGDLPQ